MPRVNIVVETPLENSVRKKQLEGIFELPPQSNLRHEWNVHMPYEEKHWTIGLIVGPSGSGKSQIARRIFGDESPLSFSAKSVIDDFEEDASISDIADVCQAVGFNTIPSWLKPFHVLSNGEKFRVELARRLLLPSDMIVIDEFTSVVDRQVAKIASHAVQKYIRKRNRRLVAVTCHYDVVDWLQPDWIYDTQDHTFQWRLVRRRPSVDCVFSPVDYSAWSVFSPFHYMSTKLHRSARCFGLFIDDQIVCFAGVLHRPISRNQNKRSQIRGISRLVTLPDFQGLGLGMILCDRIGALYKATNTRIRTYPAHPSLIRSFDRSPQWAMIKKPSMSPTSRTGTLPGLLGGRPNATFEYAGPAVDEHDAENILSFFAKDQSIQRRKDKTRAKKKPPPRREGAHHGISTS